MTPTGAGRLVAGVGLVVSLATLVAVAAGASGVAVLVITLAFATLGPGSAVVGHLRGSGPVSAAALAVVLSLSIFVAVPTVIAWTGHWAPTPSVLALAGLSVLSCGVAVLRGPRPDRTDHADATDRPAPDTPRWRRALLDVAIIVVALAAWLLALHRTDVRDVGEFGLLGALSPVFFVAPALLVGGAVAELVRGARRRWALASYLLALIVVLHATTPALLALPEYAWTYKHIGVIAFFASGRHIPTGTTDIYQQWPSFFAGAAQLTGVSTVEPLSYAAWAPVYFNVVGSFVLYAAARSLTRDRRIPFATVITFQCVNWVEEDYLSPQGLAFILASGVLFIVLRWLRADAPAGGRLDRLRRGMEPAPVVAPRARTAAVVAVLVTMAALSATHQLSPFLVAAGVAGLVVVGVVRPWWLGLAVPAIPMLYLVPRFASVSGAFTLFNGINILSNAGGTTQSWGTVGQAASALTVRTVTLVVWALVAWTAWRNRHAPGRLLAPLVLAVVPFGLVFAQNYGGEAIYRVFLFSAPWCAYLLADLAFDRPHRTQPVRRLVTASGTTVALLLVLVAGVQGRHGQLMVDQQDRANLAAAEYLYAHARPGATIILATPDFPSRVAANYDEFNRSVAVGEPDLVIGAKLSGVLDGDALPAVESFASSFEGTATYLVVSGQMKRQARYFGYLPDGSLDALQAAISQAPQWSIFYRNADVTIYELPF